MDLYSSFYKGNIRKSCKQIYKWRNIDFFIDMNKKPILPIF